jgi:hypothetical protein
MPHEERRANPPVTRFPKDVKRGALRERLG